MVASIVPFLSSAASSQRHLHDRAPRGQLLGEPPAANPRVTVDAPEGIAYGVMYGFNRQAGSIMNIGRRTWALPGTPAQNQAASLGPRRLPTLPGSLASHTFCAHLLQAGLDVREVQRLAGHRDLRTTQRYVDALKRSDRPVSSLLGPLLGKLSPAAN